MNRILATVAPGVLGIGLWQLIVVLGDLPAFLLPSPLRVVEAGWANRDLLLEHAMVTLIEVAIGLCLGVILGTITALFTMRYDVLARFIMPWLLVSQAIPVFALAPLFVLWFGYGMASKIAMALLIIFFPVTSSLLDGLRRTDAGLLDLARTYGAGPWAILLRIRFPSALGSLATGLRLAAVYAPIGAVIGEWVGASAGLGYLMLLANGRMKVDLMFAALAVLATMTISLYWLVGALARYAERWSSGSAMGRAAQHARGQSAQS